MMDLLITGAKLITGDVVDIAVAEGRIAAISPVGTGPASDEGEIIDGTGLTALPGIIDPHVHLNWPLDRDPSEIMKRETHAAAAGGVTTVGHYPLGIRDDLIVHLSETERLARDLSAVDVAVSYPILNGDQLKQMDELFARGITSFKMLRPYRPPDVYSFGGVDDALLYRMMLKVAGMRRDARPALLKIHCENVELFKVYKEDLQARYPDLGRDEPLSEVTWAHCRPAIVESESVNSALYLANVTGCPIMIVHLSAGLSLEPIRRAKRDGVEVYVETTPLYLENDAYSTGSPSGPAWTRVQPSVKFREDAEALWGAVDDGTIDLIGTDHCATQKSAYVGKSVWDYGASGRSLLGIELPLMLDAVAKGKLTLTRLVSLMCEVPAEVLNIDDRKGKIAVGYDADITLCNLDIERPVTVESLHSFADHSPFEGRILQGWPHATILRGHVIWADGHVIDDSQGQYVPGRIAP